MMESLRRGARTWVAKVLFAVLILSFAVWGVSGSLQGVGQGALARVGSIDISATEFQQFYQVQFDNLRRRFGGRITAEQARAFGFEQQVLSQLVSGAAIDNHTRDLQLGISDETVTQRLRRDPRFAGADGQFNKAAYTYFLQQSGLTERALLAAARREEVRDQLTVLMVEAATPSRAMVEILHKHREETRRIAHFTLDPGKVPAIGEPDEAKLTALYEQNKRRFMSPERRSATILLLTADQFKSGLTITDDEIKAAYAQNAERYAAAERRRIQQLAFPDKVAAEAAAKAIAGGKSFSDVAREMGARDADIDLGLVTKKSMIDQKIADAAFTLPMDVISPVIEGRFSNVILRVTEIEAGSQKQLAEVSDELRKSLEAERAAAEIQKLYDEIDKGRTGGKSLKDLASTLKLKLIELVNADRANKTADGQTAIEGPDAERIIGAVFANRAGNEADPAELSDGGFAWIDLQGTTSEKQREFADAKADVTALWVETETRNALNAAAKALADRTAAGEDMDKLAAEAGGKAVITDPTLRAGKPVGLTEQAVNQAFALALNGAASTDTVDGKSRVIFKVVEIIAAPPITPEQVDRAKADLRTQIQRDTIASYLAGLQERYTVNVDPIAMQRAIGADRDRQAQ